MPGEFSEHAFVSRAGLKLAHALDQFGLSPRGLVCADIGSNAGGFVDCLLSAGAKRVHAIERGYGVLHFRLRTDPRVVVMERTDAIHARLPEPVDLVTIDAGWTRQRIILPAAARFIRTEGVIITLIKPHYEAPTLLENGVLPNHEIAGVLDETRGDIADLGLRIISETESPILGHAGNREFLWQLSANGC